MKKFFITVLCLLIVAPVLGQPVSLDELLQEVRRDRQVFRAENLPGNAGTEALMENYVSAQNALAAEIEANDNFHEQFSANELELEAMAERLRIEAGDMSDVFAVLNQYSADAAAALKSSLVSAQFGTRSDLLSNLSQSGNIPSPGQLQEFHVLMLQEMVQSGKVARFSTETVNAAGVPATTEVVRVGMFNLISEDKFLRYEFNNGTIQELARQPANRYRSDAESLFSATSGVTAMAVDPTAGQLLSLLIQTPNLSERVKQGGPVGYVIIALGLLGLLIGLYRLFFLGAAGARIRNQLRAATVNDGNALGRILSVYSQNQDVNTETLELKLDEAIIKETPKLEKWQVALKVIAAVAPLLGLLGTVIGMIETFHQITLFGTSDPRLMADGISKALVTTMLGLLVAIPMVLIHAMVASRSKHLIEILEEQSAAIIAKQAEKNL